MSVGGRDWSFTRKLWEDPPLPDALGEFCRLLADGTDLPVWLMENGICNRVIDGVAHPRLDGWTRSRYRRSTWPRWPRGGDGRRAHRGLPALDAVRQLGVGLDEPRFGLDATERPSGRRLATDAMGDDAASVYRDAIAALRG